MGLSVAGVTYEDDKTVEPGKIIRQSPEEGTEMYVGDEIFIVVSGSEEDMTIMPALLG